MISLPLNKNKISTVCKMGQGAACCRYLMFGPDGMQCAKLDQGWKALLDKRVAEGTIGARGDNCEGES